MAEIVDALLEAVGFAVRKRDGRIVDFDRAHIERAIEAAFRAELGLSNEHSLPPKIETDVSGLTDAVIDEIEDEMHEPDNSVDVERIQDKVEIQLMRAGHFAVARRYIVYREDHKKPAYSAASKNPKIPTRPNCAYKKPTARANPSMPAASAPKSLPSAMTK